MHTVTLGPPRRFATDAAVERCEATTRLIGAETFLVVGAFLSVAVFLSAVLTLLPMRIVGRSMEPTLHDGDRVVVTKYVNAVRRGAVVVIESPQWPGGEPVAKRVVGVAGDTITVLGDNLLVNGHGEESHGLVASPRAGEPRARVVVPRGFVYVVGDNRPESMDSRQVGLVSMGSVRGVVGWVLEDASMPAGVDGAR